ncbi:hypothetical protein ASPZODRAFT_17884 [Penicilliopsis zonata CBS 506.65]|uniref:Phosphatidate phosphatase APP1 catalytic domain-containing protein n=1 Tax=Penicilliopsis zonata CBS 506.65 TaxID=1073090 RepID=A0A1L9SCU3_9EURO|nr:hypothetical protein ASPZODRAFT_17884 [Penicilliopsis zonata CBS 506.65]OJJ44974.1 hypothetical protein ASPZODRAFT_17884 [Penicilliopsis zonata CBS 506.65]
MSTRCLSSLTRLRRAQHAVRFHGSTESDRRCGQGRHMRPSRWITQLVAVANGPQASANTRAFAHHPGLALRGVCRVVSARIHSSSCSTAELSSTPVSNSRVSEEVTEQFGYYSDMAVADEAKHGPLADDEVAVDPESDVDVPLEAEELQNALSRPPPVNSDYLPLPWKGRLGYACLNTYLRYSNPPVFCSRTCRIASILENRHPLADPLQPAHPTKNRPDRTQPADVARGQAFVESLGLANARDLVKMVRWNDRYGIKFMRLSSEMFPFASHKEYGYKLAPFASEVLADTGRVIAELGHRVSVHPGQFTQLGSPKKEVVESSFRDLEYHSEMLQLLQLPPQQDRDAVMILHMGGVFGDKEATLDRFRENYKLLSQDVKNRLVLENDDVSWTVHDLLPICEELNIPLVLDYHHHNIMFDSSQLREGTLDIMALYDRIKATWTRKEITQKMHYSEPEPSAITNRQRRKHSPRVSTLPPCDPTMDLMIEAKDKEQAVFELMRNFRLPGHNLFSDIIPHIRDDENKPFKPPRKPSSKKNGFVDLDALAPPPPTVSEDEVGMGGPEGRVYWPPGMEEWLRPAKKTVKVKATKSPKKSRATKKTGEVEATTVDGPEAADEAPEISPQTPVKTPRKRAQRTSSVKKQVGRKRKASESPSTPSSSENESPGLDGMPEPSLTISTAVRRSRRAKKVMYIQRKQQSPLETLAPKPPFRTRWLPPPPTFWRQPPSRFLPSIFQRRKRNPRTGALPLVLRVLFGPHASRRVLSRLWGFRHETIPALGHRAQARIYKALVNRQARLQRRRRAGGGVLAYLLGRRTRGVPGWNFSRSSTGGGRVRLGGSSWRRLKKDASRGAESGPSVLRDAEQKRPMAQSGLSSSMSWGPADETPAREPGARRKKVFEYLKAANELRQTYQAQWAAQRNGAQRDLYDDTPGAFPDVDVARSGDVELVLFPSYARRLGRRQTRSRVDSGRYGTTQWEDLDEDNTVVDVDVHGWISAPHRGPPTRKQRLIIALARKLSGVPAPPSVAAADSSEDSSQDMSSAARLSAKGEDEFARKEAERMIHDAERDADPEWRAASSDDPDERFFGRPPRRTTTQSSITSTRGDLSMENTNLMERLRPFLSSPVGELPVTVFFFNDDKSQARNVLTDEFGHFSLRAALPFVPTQLRILASESLSVSQAIRISEPSGISLISDIDDTVKHSAITGRARDIFRNVFVRELADLKVDGVAEWYKKLTELGVEIHYVSNAPWQLYSLLDKFFKLVGLPQGSFQMKQYTGRLQGIFEPAAEKKRASLDRILRDFPERKFILVGDSGEADLEVYTDLVMANPGRVLGVFIRDVTTPAQRKFFEKSVNHLERPPAARSVSTGQISSQSDPVEKRPALPPRPPRGISAPVVDAQSLDNEDLIDLRDEEEGEKSAVPPATQSRKPVNSRQPPAKPSKPLSLRTAATSQDSVDGGSKETNTAQLQDVIRRKPVPPLPSRRPVPTAASSMDRGTDGSPGAGQPLSTGITNTIQNAVVGAYNTLPSTADYLPIQSKASNANLGESQQSSDSQSSSRSKQPPPPPPPPRRSNTAASTTSSSQNRQPQPKQSYPAAAATAAYQYASDRLGGSSSPATTFSQMDIVNNTNTYNNTYNYNNKNGDGNNLDSYVPPAPLPNKREELWRRRWERARGIFEGLDIVLGSWRVGSDVQDVCVWLVQEELQAIQSKRQDASSPKPEKGSLI